jgi:Flp pilus assembly protein TadB
MRSTLRLEMAWQYRPRSPEGESANTLYEYQIRLRAAELREEEVNLDTEPRALRRFNTKRLRNVALLWTVVVLVIAGVATWFLDQLVAAEIVAVVTATVIFTTLPRFVRASDRSTPP